MARVDLRVPGKLLTLIGGNLIFKGNVITLFLQDVVAQTRQHIDLQPLRFQQLTGQTNPLTSRDIFSVPICSAE